MKWGSDSQSPPQQGRAAGSPTVSTTVGGPDRNLHARCTLFCVASPVLACKQMWVA